MLAKRFFGSALLAAVVIVPSALAGCSSDSPLCCTEFEVGGNITADIGGSAQSQVAAQAVADFAGIAGAAVSDLTTACRGIAQDLDAPKADQDAAEATADDTEKMNAWCNLAVKAIGSAKATAKATLNVVVKPPTCAASISAKANCQAKCSAEGKCDIKANPPTCEGGKLTVACKGECTAKAGASVSCTGTCTGSCSGKCTAEGGVACNGKCDGTCEASGSGGGSGIQADGTCKGTCKGTCEVTAPSAKCEGSCEGQCDASCKGSAEASVKCDGECKGDFEPLKCEGGELKGGCQVDAKCDANCDASVKAKAECTPPEVTIDIQASGDVNAVAKLKATLETNLKVIFGLKARLDGMASIGATFTGNISAVTDIKAACIPVLASAAGDAVAQVTASVSASGSVIASVK